MPLLIVGVALVSAIGYVIAIAADTPPLSELKPRDKGATSVVYAADGSRLGYVRSDEIRTPVSWSDMPPAAREATIAIEDERFYEHEGVDYSAIIRAGVKNLESGNTVQGGSTITQQLVRALYIKDPQRNFERKIREAKLAQELEDEHPGRAGKNWILREYLNSVPYGTELGRTAIGIEAAAQTYFSKHARNLTLDESALLAGLPQAPSQYNPFRNPTAALERRNEVLQKMADNGYITPTEADAAASRAARPGPGHRRYTTRREPYFFDFVEEQLIEEYGVGAYRQGGLEDPHDDRPRAPGRRPRRDQEHAAVLDGPELGDRLDRPGHGLHQGDGRRAAPTRTARSTSPPRATASPARRSRRSCSSRRSARASTRTPRPTRRSRSTSTSPGTGRGRSRPTTTPTAGA